MTSRTEFTAKIEPFDSFWEAPDDIEKGYGSFYNHANPANLSYALGERGEGNETIVYTATREIRAHEELTINYSTDGAHISDDGEWWFREMGVKLITTS